MTDRKVGEFIPGEERASRICDRGAEKTTLPNDLLTYRGGETRHTLSVLAAMTAALVGVVANRAAALAEVTTLPARWAIRAGSREQQQGKGHDHSHQAFSVTCPCRRRPCHPGPCLLRPVAERRGRQSRFLDRQCWIRGQAHCCCRPRRSAAGALTTGEKFAWRFLRSCRREYVSIAFDIAGTADAALTSSRSRPMSKSR